MLVIEGFYKVFVLLLFGYLVLYFVVEDNKKDKVFQELEENYEIKVASIGDETYSNEDITYTLTGISRFEIIIASKNKEGDTVEYTYSRKMSSFFELKGTIASIKFRSSDGTNGELIYYIEYNEEDVEKSTEALGE